MNEHEARPVNGYGNLPTPVTCVTCGEPIKEVSSDGDRWHWVHNNPLVRAREIMDRLDTEEDDRVRSDLLNEMYVLADVHGGQVREEIEGYR